MHKKYNISKDLPIISIWGIQDGCDRANVGWSSKCPTHDHSFCLLNKGRIQLAIENERITRNKFDATLSHTIEQYLYLLPNDFIAVSVNHYKGNAFISKNGLFRIEGDSFLVSDLIKPACFFINGEKKESYICSHEIAHIGSCLPFYGEFLPNSLLVHIDGLASNSSESAFHYTNKDIKLIHLGYDLLKYAQLFGYNDLTTAMMEDDPDKRLSVPGKLMGYSSYGNLNFQILQNLIENNYFSDYYNNYKYYNSIINVKKIDLHNSIFMDIAASIQVQFENKLLEYFYKYQKETETEYLYFSGGCALNIKLNAKLIRSGIFKKIFIPPCCSDSGLAIGAASIINFLRGDKIKKHTPFINNIGLIDSFKDIEIKQYIINQCVDLIFSGETIGICIGNAECGPRGLCHRSIVGLPTSEMFNKISIKMKEREWYRPVAPVMTDESAELIIDGYNNNDIISQYMLIEYYVKKSYYDLLKGIMHIDGSIRPQIIHRNDKSLKFMYKILDCLKKKYNIFCLINTSFNSKGEPMVHTLSDAINSAKKMGINYILTNNNIITIKDMR